MAEESFAHDAVCSVRNRDGYGGQRLLSDAMGEPKEIP